MTKHKLKISKIVDPQPAMRPNPLNIFRIARIDSTSTLFVPRSTQCHCFHSASVLRRTNPYSKRPETLPEPVAELPIQREGDPNHGLYAFFRNKTSVTSPNILENHGMDGSGIIAKNRSTVDRRRITAKVIRRLTHSLVQMSTRTQYHSH